jgi:hypothetical protein
MLSSGLRNSRLLRVAALASAVLLVGCGGGDDKEVGAGDQATTTTLAPAPTTAVTIAASTTTTALTTGARSPVSTTIASPLADTMVTRALVVEATTSPQVGPATINGVSYVNALRLYSYRTSQKVEIDAGRRRTRFLGVLGIPDNETSASVHQVDISLDNAAPVLSVLLKFGETKNIDLDVTNVLRIRITSIAQSNTGDSIAIGNPRFA